MHNACSAFWKKKKKKNPVISTEHISNYSGKGLGTYQTTITTKGLHTPSAQATTRHNFRRENSHIKQQLATGPVSTYRHTAKDITPKTSFGRPAVSQNNHPCSVFNNDLTFNSTSKNQGLDAIGNQSKLGSPYTTASSITSFCQRFEQIHWDLFSALVLVGK